MAPEVQPVIYLALSSAAGSLLLWCKLGANQEMTVYGLGHLWKVLGFRTKLRSVLELLSFLAIGICVVLFFANPYTLAQAFSVGLGWTALLTTHQKDTQQKDTTQKNQP